MFSSKVPKSRHLKDSPGWTPVQVPQSACNVVGRSRANDNDLMPQKRKVTLPSNRDQLVKKFEEELTCAICLGKFKDPKVLPCLHTYCKECIDDLVSKSPKKTTSVSIVCPQCREEHLLPAGGVEKLITSFTFTNMIKLLEVYKADEPDGKELTCENGLDNNPAVARCIECEVYLCNTCCQMHEKMVATREHTTKLLEDIKHSGDKSLQILHRCPSHKKEVLKLYCQTCSKTICGDCTYVDHRSHQYVFITDVQDELKTKLGQALSTMRSLASEAKQKKEKADKLMEDHKNKVASAHTEVDNNVEKLIQHLKTRQTDLHCQINTQAMTKQTVISSYIEEAELTLTRLTSNVDFIERLLQSSDACEVATMTDATLKQCKKLDGTQVQKSMVKANGWVLDGMERSSNAIGSIGVKQSPSSCKVDLPDLEAPTKIVQIFPHSCPLMIESLPYHHNVAPTETEQPLQLNVRENCVPCFNDVAVSAKVDPTIPPPQLTKTVLNLRDIPASLPLPEPAVISTSAELHPWPPVYEKPKAETEQPLQLNVRETCVPYLDNVAVSAKVDPTIPPPQLTNTVLNLRDIPASLPLPEPAVISTNAELHPWPPVYEKPKAETEQPLQLNVRETCVPYLDNVAVSAKVDPTIPPPQLTNTVLNLRDIPASLPLPEPAVISTNAELHPWPPVYEKPKAETERPLQLNVRETRVPYLDNVAVPAEVDPTIPPPQLTKTVLNSRNIPAPLPLPEPAVISTSAELHPWPPVYKKPKAVSKLDDVQPKFHTSVKPVRCNYKGNRIYGHTHF